MNFFSVTWRIENFSMCMHRKGNALRSPAFALPELSNTYFCMWLYPNGSPRVEGNYVSCLIQRQDHVDNSNVTSFRTMFSVINNTDINSSEIIHDNSLEILSNGNRVGIKNIISREKLFKDKSFLPNDVFTLQLCMCPILENQNETVTYELQKMFLPNNSKLNFTIEGCIPIDSERDNTSVTHLSFLTHIPVERMVLNWSIKELDEKRKSKEKMSIIMESKFQEGVVLRLDCYFESSESLKIDVSSMGTAVIGVKFEVIIYVSSTDDSSVGNNSEYLLDNRQRRSFTLIDKFSDWKKKNFIHYDSVKMKCDFRISHISKNYGPNSWVDKSGSSGSFSGDTSERQPGVVRMEDTDTVERQKDYLHNGNLPDLKTEDVLKLFSVADKYKIEKLEDECIALLKKNISVENVYDILTTVYKPQDKELPDYIIDFWIAEMNFNSDEWKAFKDKNGELADEIMKKCEDRKNKTI